MKRTFFVVCVWLLTIGIHAQLVNRFAVDLTKSKKHRVTVTCEVPEYKQETLIYQIPKAVPGSYSIKNFGDYIDNFRAYDRRGKRLKVVYDNRQNNFTISTAIALARISYEVRDTWTDTRNQNYVFQPGGTYFEPKTLFCLNTFALFGYFDGFVTAANEIRIKKDASLFCSTSAPITSSNPEEDVVRMPDYNTMQDTPLVYMYPDTVSLVVNNCRFHIAVFSRNRKVTAQKIVASIRPILTKAFPSFFTSFPTDHYTFTFLFPGWQDEALMGNGGMGAMEHRTSSVYFYPETENQNVLNSFLHHVVTHEFLHVLTPLSLKSEQIYKFDYLKPKASQHLWLYEGGIEYLSNQLLYRDSVMSERDYLESMRQKLLYSRRYKNISMTEFSKQIFDNSDMMYYANVYNKGALVSLLFDIRMNELTEGRMNLKKLLLALESKYRGRYFEDDKLFDEMVKMTHPGMREFIDDYIIGTKPLPVAEYLHHIGIQLTAEKPDSIYTFGRVSVEYDNRANQCVVRDAAPNYNAFNLDKGDVILAINDTTLNETNYYRLVQLIGNPDKEAEIAVRYSRNGKISEIKNPPIKVKVTQLDFLEPETNLSDEQRLLRKRVLGR